MSERVASSPKPSTVIASSEPSRALMSPRGAGIGLPRLLLLLGALEQRVVLDDLQVDEPHLDDDDPDHEDRREDAQAAREGGAPVVHRCASLADARAHDLRSA